jgi:hypothetical protein
MRLLCLLLTLATLPAPAFAQSLGEAARKEEERRQKNKEKGVQAPRFDDSKIAKTGPAAPVPAASPVAAAATPDPADSESERRVKEEQLWRGRMQEARIRRDAAKKAYDDLGLIWMGPRQVLVDDEGRVLVRDLDHLRQLVADAKTNWERTEQAIRDLEDAGRRAGALPGWLR